MDENKKETKKPENVEKVEKKEVKKVEEKAKQPEVKNEAKFEKVNAKEVDKISKSQNKEVKKKNKKDKKTEGKKKSWVPTTIVTLVVIAIIAVLTVMIVVSSDPKKSLDGLLTNLRAGNFDKAQEYLSGDETELTDTTLDTEAQKLLFEKLSWNIKKVTQEKDKATIVVEVRNKDFQTVVNNYAKRALNAAKEAIGNGKTENISEQDFQQYFLEELKNEEIQTTTNEKTINAVKVDNKWKIVSDDELVNAILPGLEDAINTLS